MRQLIRRYPIAAFLVLVTVLGWLAVLVGTTWMPIDAEHPMTPLHGILVFLIASPSVVGVVLTAVVDGRQGLKELWARAIQWRVSVLWYALALIVPFSVSWLSYTVQGWLGGPSEPIDLASQAAFILPFALMACVLEEFGWRGYLLPRLQARFSPSTSAWIVGVAWLLWHTAINYLGLAGLHSGGRLWLMLLIAGQLNLSLSFLMSWVNNRTDGSMLLVVIAHFSVTMGNVFGLVNPSPADAIRAPLISALVHWAVVIVITLLGGLKLERTTAQQPAQVSQ